MYSNENGYKPEAIKLTCVGCSLVVMGRHMRRLNPVRSDASICLSKFSGERQNVGALLVLMIASARFFPKC